MRPYFVSLVALHQDVVSDGGGAARVQGLQGKPIAAEAAGIALEQSLVFRHGSYVPVSLKPVFNVVSFGAVADNGKTDNAPFFQAAIAAAAAVGGEVYVPRPPGGAFYGVASPLVISGDRGAAGIRLFGDSSAADTGGAESARTSQPRIAAMTGAGSAFAPNRGSGASLALYVAKGEGAAVLAVTGTEMTLGGIFGLVKNAFSRITIAGSSHPANNGTWLLSRAPGVNTAEQLARGLVVVANARGAVAPDRGLSWSVTARENPSMDGTVSVVLAPVPSEALARVAAGDRCTTTNSAAPGNAGYFTVSSVEPGQGTGSCILRYQGGIAPDQSAFGFQDHDSGLAGGVHWSFGKPLLKIWARGVTVENLQWVGGGPAVSECINIANDATGATLTTNVRVRNVSLGNATFGIVIGDSGGSGETQGNCDFGSLEKVYTVNCAEASFMFISRGGQNKSWVLDACAGMGGRYGIYQVSGSFHTRGGCNWSANTVASIAISQGTDVFSLQGDNCEGSARYLLAPHTGGSIHVIIDGLRFDSFALTDNAVILWGAGSGLCVRNASCNYGDPIATHLVALSPLGIVDAGLAQVQVEVSHCSIGGAGPLVVPAAHGAGGIYEVGPGCTASDGQRHTVFDEGRFRLFPEAGVGATIALAPQYVPNLALTTGQLAPLARVNEAIAYQGFTCMEMHGDPGGPYALNGMLPPPPTLGGSPGDSQFDYLLFAPRELTVAHLDANVVPGRRFQCKGGGAGRPGGGASSLVLPAPAPGGWLRVKGRYSALGDPAPLAGAATATVTHASAAIAFSAPQSLPQGAWLTIEGVHYRLAEAVRNAIAARLTAPYAGRTNPRLAAAVCHGAWIVTDAG